MAVSFVFAELSERGLNDAKWHLLFNAIVSKDTSLQTYLTLFLHFQRNNIIRFWSQAHLKPIFPTMKTS
jgi:hypothetical protein